MISVRMTALVAVACASMHGSVSGGPVLEVIGPLPSPFVNATGFRFGDAAGTVVLGTMEPATAPVTPHAFKWTAAGGVVDIAVASGVANLAFAGLSSDGSTYGGYTQNLASAVRWVPPSAAQTLPQLPGLSAFGSVTVMSADGAVMGGVMSQQGNGGGSKGFVWSVPTGTVDMGLPAVSSWVNLQWMSGDGAEVIGGTIQASTRRIFRWTQATGAVYLPAPAGSRTSNFAVSGNGQVVAGRVETPPQAERLGVWVNDAVTDYGPAPVDVPEINVNGVSDTRVVVGRFSGPSAATGYVWKKNTGFLRVREHLVMLGYDLSMWVEIYDVNAITPDGRTIMGTGRQQGSPNRVTWVARNAIPPACDGDFDGDGDVDTADLAALLGGFGSCPGGTSYKIHLNMNEADPCINTGDLVLMLAAFGQTCG